MQKSNSDGDWESVPVVMANLAVVQAGSSTGVHDTVVNQLLTKLDGVEQLNNILVIGMTNRKDMIDEALLRPGRMEVQLEISLPDEHGRVQILKIHTARMRWSRSDPERGKELIRFTGALRRGGGFDGWTRGRAECKQTQLNQLDF